MTKESYLSPSVVDFAVVHEKNLAVGCPFDRVNIDANGAKRKVAGGHPSSVT